MSSFSLLSLLALCGDIVTLGQAGKRLAHNQEKKSVENFITFLERKKVLYAQIDQERRDPVIRSLEKIKERTESLREEVKDKDLRRSLGKLVDIMSEELANLWAYDTLHRNGQMKMFMSLQRVRTEMARNLAILCYAYGVDPASTELQSFIVNMATVRPIPVKLR